jgi:YidC/Oxa1 family membrane protein insertase
MSIYWIAQNLFSLIQEFLAGRILKKDYEKAAQDAKRREEEEKEEERRQRETERAERSKRIEETKNKKKDAKREFDDKSSAAVKEASRVGIRAYARGRAYDPNRFSTGGAAAEPEAASDEPETEEK